ncbi:uncharacterized protein LOC128200410 [Galleria mellonella]|uniref:Uncharacterized protein LOC128200410 n=1 Tax=Galleria mellonella TaxID=7137 RepID=A0ABM3MF53_GALME|nr:uncharacterized protein LOC128200410 [Galleria mellonella]
MADTALPFVRELKLLGVTLDEKLSFNRHVQLTIDKATRIFNRLCLFCRPTWGAHPENVRTIYQHVVEPIITYAAGVWGQAALKKGIKRRLLRSTHLLRSDLSLDRPTPPHKLLHPAVRVSITSLPYSSLTTSQSSLTIYTDGSKLENSDTGAAFVAYSENKQIAVKKFKLHRSCSVFQAELLAILKACTWANSFHPHSHITIITDSQAALAALRDRSNTHPLVSQTHAQIHSRTSGSLSFVWVKGHIGVDGNEAADSAAKYAAASHSSLSYASYPMSFVKHNIRAEHNRIWQARYESSSQGRHTISLLPKLTDITRFRQLVKTSFHITQILTGHGYTKQYLHRFNIAADDACPCDDSTTQTFEHLLEYCPRFSPKRLNHVLLCNNLRLPPFLTY